MTTYPPPSPQFIQARFHGGSQTPKGIVIHGTVSSDNPGTARDIANWWHGPTSPQTSAHYIVDPTTEIQTVGDHVVAYHCGYNTGTIAVELCDEQSGPANRWKDSDSQDILDRAARLVAQLALAYGIEVRRPSVAELKKNGPHGIYGHNDSRLAFGNTTHTDPKDFDWPDFLARVQREVNNIKNTKTQASASIDVVVATNNVMSLPLNKSPLATIKTGGASTVRMLQEIDGKGIKAAARSLPHLKPVDIPDGSVYAAGILYNPSVWTELGHRYVKQYDGVSGISQNRHFCVAELQHRRTGQVVAFISFHDVTAGSDKNRKRMRKQGRTALKKVISGYRALGIPVIVGGDYNTTKNVHPTANLHVQNKIDHIYVWNGGRWSLRRKKVRHINTASDHDVLILRMGLTIK